MTDAQRRSLKKYKKKFLKSPAGIAYVKRRNQVYRKKHKKQVKAYQQAYHKQYRLKPKRKAYLKKYHQELRLRKLALETPREDTG